MLGLLAILGLGVNLAKEVFEYSRIPSSKFSLSHSQKNK